MPEEDCTDERGDFRGDGVAQGASFFHVQGSEGEMQNQVRKSRELGRRGRRVSVYGAVKEGVGMWCLGNEFGETCGERIEYRMKLIESRGV